MTRNLSELVIESYDSNSQTDLAELSEKMNTLLSSLTSSVTSSIQTELHEAITVLTDSVRKYNEIMATSAQESLSHLVQVCTEYCELYEERNFTEISAYIKEHEHLIDESWTLQETLDYLDQLHEDEVYWDTHVNNLDAGIASVLSALSELDAIDLPSELIVFLWLIVAMISLSKKPVQ